MTRSEGRGFHLKIESFAYLEIHWHYYIESCLLFIVTKNINCLTIFSIFVYRDCTWNKLRILPSDRCSESYGCVRVDLWRGVCKNFWRSPGILNLWIPMTCVIHCDFAVTNLMYSTMYRISKLTWHMKLYHANCVNKSISIEEEPLVIKLLFYHFIHSTNAQLL